MTTEVKFTNLDSATVEEYAEFLAAMIIEAYPDLNLSKGSALFDLLVRPAAAAHVYESTDMDALRNQWNFAYLESHPDEASTDIVDALLTNFNAVRSVGTKAVGPVDVVLNEQHAMVMASGTSFTAGSLVFTTITDNVIVATEDDVTSDSDLVLTARTDGTYSFRVLVAASDYGVAGNIGVGTDLTPSPAPMFFASAAAAADFSGGSDPDTNADVLARARQGITCGVLSNGASAARSIIAAIPSTTAVSVVGMNDQEMTRDQRSLLGSSNGGRVDAYVRTQTTLDTSVVVKTGAVEDPLTHSWYLLLDRDDLAGVYSIVSILPQDDPGLGSLEIIQTLWGYNTGNLDVAHDVQSAEEAAFTCFQTANILFRDPSNAGVYDVRLRRLPFIGDVQAYCDDPDHIDPLADWVVRGPIPMSVSVSLKIKAPSGTDVDVDAVTTAVVNAVNAVSFSDELNASVVVNAAQAVLPTGAYVAMPIEIVGALTDPTRHVTYIRSNNTLQLPSGLPATVTRKTVAYFTNTDSISVSVEAI